MKYIALALALIGTTAVANVKPPFEYVKESYQYCIDSFDDDAKTDADVLECVNEEMEAEGYDAFPSIKALKAYIKKNKKD